LTAGIAAASARRLAQSNDDAGARKVRLAQGGGDQNEKSDLRPYRGSAC
jgi:hypothetical protein